MSDYKFPTIEDILANFDKFNEELNKQFEEEDKKFAEAHPEQAACDHGVSFDEEAAKKLLEETPADSSLDPTVAFIMGSPAHLEIRKRWPRLSGQCPKGCGYNGIAYASNAHYLYGDW